MDIEDILKETLEGLLNRLDLSYTKITVTEDEENNYLVNISSDDASSLIGYHGYNIQAIQHILKVLCWQKSKSTQYNIIVDVDSYRQRQEEKAIAAAQRKVDMARKSGRPQKLPPMSPFLRRKVHLYCMGAGFEDIETISEGAGDNRHIIIKLK